MHRLQSFHNFLKQSLFSRCLVYLLALLQPVCFFISFGFDLFFYDKSPYDLMWIGFYSCVLAIWAYHEKPWEMVINIVLVCANLIPVSLWCMGACMGGLAGLLWALSTLTIPAFIIMKTQGVFTTILVCAGLIILIGILALGIRKLIRIIDSMNEEC